MGRRWYEVRVREKRSDGRDVKKSKFYQVSGPREAAHKYGGSGFIMWISKVSQEKLHGVGEFFHLGDELLRDLRRGDNLLEQVKDKNKRRGYYERKRKEATD